MKMTKIFRRSSSADNLESNAAPKHLFKGYLKVINLHVGIMCKKSNDYEFIEVKRCSRKCWTCLWRIAGNVILFCKTTSISCKESQFYVINYRSQYDGNTAVRHRWVGRRMNILDASIITERIFNSRSCERINVTDRHLHQSVMITECTADKDAHSLARCFFAKRQHQQQQQQHQQVDWIQWIESSCVMNAITRTAFVKLWRRLIRPT